MSERCAMCWSRPRTIEDSYSASASCCLPAANTRFVDFFSCAAARYRKRPNVFTFSLRGVSASRCAFAVRVDTPMTKVKVRLLHMHLGECRQSNLTLILLWPNAVQVFDRPRLPGSHPDTANRKLNAAEAAPPHRRYHLLVHDSLVGVDPALWSIYLRATSSCQHSIAALCSSDETITV